MNLAQRETTPSVEAIDC